jgi:hypothetical protein
MLFLSMIVDPAVGETCVSAQCWAPAPVRPYPNMLKVSGVNWCPVNVGF